MGSIEVPMKFREDVKLNIKEIKKEIDTEQNLVIINKTMKAPQFKTIKDKPKRWLDKPYVGKIKKD